MSEPIVIDVWSDIACPWCYIGKRHLESALAEFRVDHPDREVAVNFHSYLLNPAMPTDYPGTQTDYLVQAKGLDREQVVAMTERVVQVAANAGLTYNMADMVMTNTTLAHELTHFARERGLGTQMTERLFAAHFTEGRHVGQVGELVALAAEVGLDESDARAALESHAYATAVQTDIDAAVQIGVTGVPFFVINGVLGISGAQPPSTFRRALAQILDTAD